MYSSLLFLYLLINIVYTQNNQCSLLNNKLSKYGVYITIPENNFLGLKLCHEVINDYCCPQIYENQIKNATAVELYQLLELHSIHVYEPLLRLTIQLNDTIIQLIQSSRTDTHLILQRTYKSFYDAYRSSVDLFFDNLLTIAYKSHQYDINNNIEELFHNLLRVSIELSNENKSIIPSSLLCLWRNHPFGNRPKIMVNQLEINLGKIFYLNELLKLNIELVQTISTSVTTDSQCIDSYMQLSYCNLCSGRKELPCLSNCANIIENCLVNVSLINDVWMNFIDSMENVAYFDGIEKALSSISTSIFDALMTFFNSDGIQSKDIINQCGYIHIRKEIFDYNEKFHSEQKNSVSLLDKQLMSMRSSLRLYRSFWLMLPEQICKSDGLSASNEQICWTGTSISKDKRQSIRTYYDKSLSLRLQWILKEIREKTQIIGNMPQTSTVINLSVTTTNTDAVLINEVKLNLTDDLDDYPHDDEFHYSDYAYEDTIDGFTSSTTTTTTLQSSSISLYEDIIIDDINTVSYYDYGEHDVYSDEETEETSTRRLSPVTTTTTVRIPLYHQRPPIIWNINIGDDDFTQQSTKQNNSSSTSRTYSILFITIMIFIVTSFFH